MENLTNAITKHGNETIEQSIKIDVSDLVPREKAVLGVIPYAEARPMIDKYRTYTNDEMTEGIYYDQMSLKTYLDDNFIKYTEEVKLPKRYSWRIAFCPMFVNKSSTARLTVCIVPVIVDPLSFEVFDYFECRKATTGDHHQMYVNYFEPLEKKVTDAGLKSFIFDEGNLWP